MKVWFALRFALLCSAVAAHAAPRIIEIPALSYGKGRWSVIKLTNPAAEQRAVTVDVYGSTGGKLPVGGHLDLKPHATAELRVEALTENAREMCWARITDLSGDTSGGPALEATAVLEVLRGNTIESFPRPAHEASRNTRWLSPSWSVQNHDLYFLNASDKPVEVSFCTTAYRVTPACPKSAIRHLVGANQSIMLAIGKLRQQYFLTVASARGRALLVTMVAAEGDRKVFSSDSSIRFGEPATQ